MITRWHDWITRKLYGRKNAWQRKIVYQVEIIFLLFLFFFLVMSIIVSQVRATTIILSPEPMVVEKPVEVPVEVPRLPDSVEEEIRAVFGRVAGEALKIARCESGLRPDAWNENTNGTVDVGLFQINSVHGVRAKWLLNPSVNIRIAKQLYDEHGHWGPWVCARKVGV